MDLLRDLWLELRLRVTMLVDLHLSGCRIDVSVREAVVRLRGCVRFGAQRMLAEAIAVRGGARRVRNELQVRRWIESS